MKKEVVELQKKMYEEGMDAYYIPSSDFHGSEYLHPYFKLREFVSGFDGSAGDMVIAEDAAYLWTDGRYFIQAEEQLKGSGIVLMKEREEGVPTIKEFLVRMAEERLSESEDALFVLGLDGRVTNADFMLNLEDSFLELMEKDGISDEDGYGRIRIKTDEDLADYIWEERPQIVPSKIYEFPLSSAGKSFEDKLSEVRAAMKKEGAGYLVLCELSEIAWLFNLRAADIDYTPIFYSYAMISEDEVRLYLMDGALPSESLDALKNVSVLSYDRIYDDVLELPLGSVVWLDPKFTNYELYTSLQYIAKIYNALTPAGALKMIKNETEQECARQVHIKDGVAVTKFIKWIKDEMASGHGHDEISASDYLEKMRREQDGFIELSFPTIAGYGSNGAIVHYEAVPGKAAPLKPEGFFLVDSGAHYIDGTTDITRNIAMGPLSQEMIDDYTYVLKSHIAFARLKSKPGATGKEIDEIIRKPLWDAGLDFNHGVGHGVGHVLSVHEDAALIRDYIEGDSGLKAGMIMSNEPGVYKEGRYGIRTENLLLFKDDGQGNIINETLTCVPYERAAINKELLTEDEIAWINEYHLRVREALTPFLDEETADFLAEQTAAI